MKAEKTAGDKPISHYFHVKTFFLPEGKRRRKFASSLLTTEKGLLDENYPKSIEKTHRHPSKIASE